MHTFAHDGFTYPLPAGHRFPLAKWRLVREAITRRRDGVAANLGGGTHHAFAHSGHGFCVFNDVVVAIRQLRAEKRVARVLVVDLDVHQGDGTHALLAADADAFTLSISGFRNFPFRRVPGDLELELADGTGVPVCVTLAGRYAEDIRDTVEINARTIETSAS